MPQIWSVVPRANAASRIFSKSWQSSSSRSLSNFQHHHLPFTHLSTFRAQQIETFKMRPSPVALRNKPAFQPHVGRFTPAAVFKWAPTLALWGGAGAGAVMLFMSNVPLFKKDVLQKLPGIAPYFEDKMHPADNAF